MIRPYLSHMINNKKTQGEWKIKLTMAIKFFSSKNSEKLVSCIVPVIMYDNIVIGIEKDKIIEDSFDSFLQRYEKGLEKSMRGSEFVFDSVCSLHYKLHKIRLNRGGS